MASEQQIDYGMYVPGHLKPFVQHLSEDFWVTPLFEPELVGQLMFEGFLPIATAQGRQHYLLPKLHEHRCCIVPKDVHASKTPKKKSKRWVLRVNTSFDQVVAGCHEQHGIPWLYPPMVECLKALYLNTRSHVRVFSIELIHSETGELGAGELGYTVGKVYTSLTGFCKVNGAGTIQLLALAGLLHRSGFELWDLGMGGSGMEYKYALGATDLPRDIFLQKLHVLRQDRNVNLEQQTSASEGLNARTLIDQLYT